MPGKQTLGELQAAEFRAVWGARQTQTQLSLLMAKAGDGAALGTASQGAPVPAAAGHGSGSTSGIQLGLLHPGSSTIDYLPLGLFASYPLGLTGLEAELSTWGFGFGAVSSLLEGISV